MTERPILFSGPMVRATQDGHKRQTRRPLTATHAKRLGLDRVGAEFVTVDGAYWDGTFEGGGVPWSPFGQPGDRLWVRETFKVEPTPGCTFGEAMMGRKLSVFYKHGRRRDLRGGAVNYAGCHIDFGAADYPAEKYGLWRPSIHMPRWASRLLLEVTDVRVERVQAISRDDALAEGVQYVVDDFARCDDGTMDSHAQMALSFAPQRTFALLWDSLYGKKGLCWQVNPWVWAVTFKAVKP